MTKNKEEIKYEINKRITLHPNVLSHVGLLSSFVLSFFIYIYSSINYPWTVQNVAVFGSEIPLPLMGIFPILILVVLVVKHFNYRYVISEDHVRTLSGIISLRMLDKRLDMQHIRGVEIERSIFDRLFNLGDLEIGSAMHGQDDLIMYGIYNPERFRKMIEHQISKINNQEE